MSMRNDFVSATFSGQCSSEVLFKEQPESLALHPAELYTHKHRKLQKVQLVKRWRFNRRHSSVFITDFKDSVTLKLGDVSAAITSDSFWVFFLSWQGVRCNPSSLSLSVLAFLISYISSAVASIFSKPRVADPISLFHISLKLPNFSQKPDLYLCFFLQLVSWQDFGYTAVWRTNRKPSSILLNGKHKTSASPSPSFKCRPLL